MSILDTEVNGGNLVRIRYACGCERLLPAGVAALLAAELGEFDGDGIQEVEIEGHCPVCELMA